MREPIPLDPVKFGTFCRMVKNQYIQELPWANMCPSVHKVLDHGEAILTYLPPTLTLSMMTEDPLENNHKHIKFNETGHVRQNSRKNRMKDLFLRDVDVSDPQMLDFVAQKRIRRRKKMDLPAEVLALCKDDLDNGNYDSD